MACLLAERYSADGVASLFSRSARGSPHSCIEIHPADASGLQPTLSLYVLLSVHRNTPYRPSYCLAPPSGCKSFRPFTEMDPSDPLASSLPPQRVCPLVYSPTTTLLNLLLPRSALRMYVLSSFLRNVPR